MGFGVWLQISANGSVGILLAELCCFVIPEYIAVGFGSRVEWCMCFVHWANLVPLLI